MRGKVCVVSHDALSHGITPAYAGKSAAIPVTRRCGRDHPRVCGEKVLVLAVMYSRRGSPPRMRGKVDALSDIIQDYGITPAYAGKSTMCAAAWPRLRDHPRVCGEKYDVCRCMAEITGSPPRVRGKVKTCGFLALAIRITPACAGKRRQTSVPSAARGDHPRVCGEKPME